MQMTRKQGNMFALIKRHFNKIENNPDKIKRASFSLYSVFTPFSQNQHVPFKFLISMNNSEFFKSLQINYPQGKQVSQKRDTPEKHGTPACKCKILGAIYRYANYFQVHVRSSRRYKFAGVAPGYVFHDGGFKQLHEPHSLWKLRDQLPTSEL
jgi:hypothetical protein